MPIHHYALKTNENQRVKSKKKGLSTHCSQSWIEWPILLQMRTQIYFYAP
jgi:hypothetical protein